MSQKILPISLRLNKKKNYNSNTICSKEKYSFFFFLEQEIRILIKNFLQKKKINIQKLNIFNKDDQIYIHIYIISKYNKNPIKITSFFFKKEIEFFLFKILKDNFSFNISIINLNNNFLRKKKLISGHFLKYQKKFKWDRKLKKIRKIFFLLNLIILTKNASLLSLFILKNLNKKKRQKRFLFLLNNDLLKIKKIYPKFLGFKFELKGRIEGRPRKKVFFKQNGPFPLSSINENIYFASDKIISPVGISSIKVWLFFDEKKKPQNFINFNKKKNKQDIIIEKLKKKNNLILNENLNKRRKNFIEKFNNIKKDYFK